VARLRRSWHSDEYARAVAAELEMHVALQVADNIRRGLSPAAARRDALIRLGGVQQTREHCFDAMTFRWLARQLRGWRAARAERRTRRSELSKIGAWTARSCSSGR
jgi:hypothetical protein